MAEFLVTAYPWIKALHIVFIIAWVAGLVMLPRYFVYHADATPGSEAAAMLVTMETRLLRIILTPAMIISWILGVLLAVTPGILSGGTGWFHVKLTAAIILSALHGLFARWARDFRNGRNKRSHKFYRLMNEVPFVLTIVIVFMVILKPF